jgi:competence protein ComEC
MRRSFWVLLAGLLGGIVLRSLTAVPWWFLVAIVVASVLCALALHGAFRAKRWYVLYLVLCVGACVFGVVRTEVMLAHYAAGQVCAAGAVLAAVPATVVREPDVRDEKQVVVLGFSSEAVHGNSACVASDARTIRVRASLPRHTPLAYGDVVEVSGTLAYAEPFMGDDGRVFRYDEFVRKERVHYVLDTPSIEMQAGERGGNPVATALFSLKRWWLSGVAQVLPEPYAALAGGVVVGAQQSLGEELLLMFRDVGLIHIVVLSGYNLTIVAVFIRTMLFWCSRRVSLVASIAAIVAFAVMVGLGPSVVRASIMAIIGILALYGGRQKEVVRALGVAVLVMVLWNPLLLVFDVGFQLSVIATLGLIYGSPVVSRWFVWVPERFELRTLLSATIATQIAVVPLLAYHVGSVSLIAPLANVLVLPVVPLAMLGGFVGGIVGAIVPSMGMVVAYPAYLFFYYIVAVAQWLSHVPHAALAVPPVGVGVTLGMYAVLIFLLTQVPHHSKNSRP